VAPVRGLIRQLRRGATEPEPPLQQPDPGERGAGLRRAGR